MKLILNYFFVLLPLFTISSCEKDKSIIVESEDKLCYDHKKHAEWLMAGEWEVAEVVADSGKTIITNTGEKFRFFNYIFPMSNSDYTYLGEGIFTTAGGKGEYFEWFLKANTFMLFPGGTDDTGAIDTTLVVNKYRGIMHVVKGCTEKMFVFTYSPQQVTLRRIK